MGEQDQGILLYQELVAKNIKAEQVQDDLKKSIILFPENEALIKLQTRQE